MPWRLILFWPPSSRLVLVSFCLVAFGSYPIPPPVAPLVGEISRGPHRIPWITHILQTISILESIIQSPITAFQVNNNHFKSCLFLSIYYVPDSWHVIDQMLITILWDYIIFLFFRCIDLPETNNRGRIRTWAGPPKHNLPNKLLVMADKSVLSLVTAQMASWSRKETNK